MAEAGSRQLALATHVMPLGRFRGVIQPANINRDNVKRRPQKNATYHHVEAEE